GQTAASTRGQQAPCPAWIAGKHDPARVTTRTPCAARTDRCKACAARSPTPLPYVTVRASTRPRTTHYSERVETRGSAEQRARVGRCSAGLGRFRGTSAPLPSSLTHLRCAL